MNSTTMTTIWQLCHMIKLRIVYLNVNSVYASTILAA